MRHAGLLTFCILLVAAIVGSGCAGPSDSASSSPAAREQALRQIASDYALTADIAQARSALDALRLANPAQLILSIAESDLGAGRPTAEIKPLYDLAKALGAESPQLVAFFAPTPIRPTATPEAPTAMPSPVASPTDIAPTIAPTEAATRTLISQVARVVAESNVNLRSGPNRAYPTIGQLQAGQEAEIIGRNASGDWWRIAWSGPGQAWVAGTVVQVRGEIDAVAVARDIPALPTRAPQPTAAPTSEGAAAPAPTAAPAAPAPAGPDFRLESVRLWGVEENGGFYDGPSVHCGEKRELHVVVLDAAGNRLNGVTVKVVYGNQEEQVTGSKGPGEVEFVLGLGQDAYILRDVDGRQVTSDYARGLSTDPTAIPIEVLMGAGFCRDAADCAHFVSQNGCRQHYSWTATFRRAY